MRAVEMTNDLSGNFMLCLKEAYIKKIPLVHQILIWFLSISAACRGFLEGKSNSRFKFQFRTWINVLI